MQLLLDAIATHPHAALLVVALVAFAESLAIVGTVVPAAIVMLGAGALVANGVLHLWGTLLAASLGAVLGDGLSYELGVRHEAGIRARPMFRRHAEAVARGEAFIRRHGATSVLLARFAGALRAFVPLLAGFARMPRARFYVVNVCSALLWAPAHILPGVWFGASLALAEAVSARLALIGVMLLLTVWTVAWLVSSAIRFVVPRIRRVRDAAVDRARGRSSLIARATLALFDPQRPDSHALLLGTVLVLGAGWLFLGVVEDLLAHDPLERVDLAVYRFLRGLRSGPGDQLMVAITELGSVGVVLPLICVVLIWLVTRRCWRTAAYWVGTVAFSEVLVKLIKWTLGRRRPLEDIYAGVEQFSFPSGHATVSTVVLAFLAFLLGRGRSRAAQVVIAVIAGVYVALVAFSRLYLGAHWLSDVLGGLSLGLTWVAFVAMVYTQRRVQEDLAPRALVLPVVATLLVCAGAWIHWMGPADLRRFSGPIPRRLMTEGTWLGDGWRRLPGRRLEMTGDPQEPLQLQWACSESGIASRMREAGWQDPPGWSLKAVLGALAPRAAIGSLPVVPRFNQGELSHLVFVRWSTQQPEKRDVLRLWRSEFELESATAMPRPLWYGAVYRESRPANAYVTQALLNQLVLPPDMFVPLLPAGASDVLRSGGGSAPQTALLLCIGP